MKLFGQSPLGLVSYEDIEDFCKEGLAENMCLDYKEALSGKDPRLQIAKLGCAFSNSMGGVMLLGISESKLPDGRGVPKDIVGIDIADKCEQRIKDICINGVVPPVLVDTATILHRDDLSKVLVVARFPESDATPHYVRENNRTYVRTGDISKIINDEGREASPAEIEWLLNRRQKPIELRESLLARAESRSPKYQEKASISISVVPLYPREPLWDLKDLKTKLIETGLPKVGARTQSANETVYVTRTDHFPGLWHVYGYLELTLQGLLFYSYEARKLPPDPIPGGSFPNCVDGMEFLNALQLLLGAAQKLYRDAGYWGLVQVSVSAANVEMRIPVKLTPLSGQNGPAAKKFIVGQSERSDAGMFSTYPF